MVRAGTATYCRVEHEHVHDVDHDGGDEEAAPPGLGDAAVPSGEISGDDGGDADGPQAEGPRGALELALLEVILVGGHIGDRSKAGS